MKLDDDKHYIKVITFDEIYNYMVELFFYLRPFRGPNIGYELLDLFYKEQNIEFFK